LINNNQKLPTFFVVGAQKSGTTTIHDLLKQNTNISLPNYKETHFFSRDYYNGIDWYLKQFSDMSYDIRGEVDPSYMFFPNTYKNIKKNISEPKFIFIFRKPLDRSYSHYMMSCSRGYEKLSFLKALELESERIDNDEKLFSFSNHSYLLRSEYSNQILDFFKYFKDSKTLFLKFDELIDLEKRKNIYKKICQFLDVDISNDVDFNINSNKASIYRSKILRNNLYNDTLLRRVMKKIIFSKKIRNKIRHKLYNINSKIISVEGLKKQKDKVFNELPEKYISWNNKEVKKLTKITNLDLNDWII
tara:strand:+ start:26196 stop:27104 length:909 start_codon:yes stop_codon:yes gene_type:complete